MKGEKIKYRAKYTYSTLGLCVIHKNHNRHIFCTYIYSKCAVVMSITIVINYNQLELTQLFILQLLFHRKRIYSSA